MFRFFSLDPCFLINSFLFYAHWIIHVQMLYWCQNVIFFENVSFWWRSWWNCIICSSICTRHAMSFFYLHIIPSLWCISSHTNQYIKIRHTHSMRIDYGVKKSMLGVNRNDDLLWYLGKLFQLLRNVWLAGDKIDLE